MPHAPIFPALPIQLGIYELTRQLGILPRSELYLAKQTHVNRHVVVEVLRPDADKDEAARFVATARERVSNPLPHTTQVLESMMSDGFWYIVQELPPGIPLPDRERKEPITIEHICQIIREASDLYLAAQQDNLSVRPLSAESIFISRLKGIHFLSPVIEGASNTPEMQYTCMQHLAVALSPFVPEGPGHTRVCTLLQWLYEGYNGQFLSWEVIRDTAKTILMQLNPTSQAAALGKTVKLHDASRELRKSNRYRRRMIRTLCLTGACVLIVALMSQLGRLFATSDPIVISPLTPEHILAKQGNNIAHIMRTPVTINDYALFLNRYKSLSEEERRKLNQEIPENAQDHTPADWDNMYQSAKAGWTWNGVQISLDSPIIGINYWDALAYSRFADAALVPANLLQEAKKLDSTPAMEEWTSSYVNGDAVLGDCCIVLGAIDYLPQAEYDSRARKLDRTFRIMRTFRATAHTK